MPKGDDYKAKKKNKAIRKKLSKDPAAAVSARVASIIAAKKRRHTGKRRQCQGMCFSLPTPEDPFNDRQWKEDPTGKKNKKPLSQTNNEGLLKNGADEQLVNVLGCDLVNLVDKRARKLEEIKLVNQHKGQGCPSKFLFNCLNSIQNSLVGDGEIQEQEKSLIASSWGFEFWKAHSMGKDMLVSSGTGPSVQQIAWIASTAADSIQQKESEKRPLKSPFLLYLVPSQAKATKVRSVCKPLKAFGIHTVSLHSGASVEHQVDGLKSCDPEFIVATPKRLWELASRKAIDISVVSMLVVEAVDSNCLDVVKRIRVSMSRNVRTVVFPGQGSDDSIKALQNMLRQPIHTLSLEE